MDRSAWFVAVVVCAFLVQLAVADGARAQAVPPGGQQPAAGAGQAEKPPEQNEKQKPGTEKPGIEKPGEGAKYQGWTNNAQQAMQASQATGKPIMVFFTGSDWCGVCKRLKAEVLDTPQFAQWAGENVILLELDFPKTTPQPRALENQNRTLQQKFGVRSFPSVRFVSSTGQTLGSLGGYTAGTGPENWIASANAALTGMPVADVPGEENPEDETGESGPILSSFTGGVAAAHEQKRPLLLVLSKSGAEKLQANLAKLLADDQLLQYAKDNLVVAHVQEPLPDDSPDQEPLAQFRQQYRIPSTPVQILLIDVAGRKILYRAGTLPNGRALVQQMQRKAAAANRAVR